MNEWEEARKSFQDRHARALAIGRGDLSALNLDDDDNEEHTLANGDGQARTVTRGEMKALFELAGGLGGLRPGDVPDLNEFVPARSAAMFSRACYRAGRRFETAPNGDWSTAKALFDWAEFASHGIGIFWRRSPAGADLSRHPGRAGAAR